MKLSIITINYNNAAGLKKTLDSVAVQTWSEFEHIIIDGGSADESVDVIQCYADLYADKYPIKWISEPDRGVYDAMNKGIKMAMGEYCLFMNGGDSLFSPMTLNQIALDDYAEDLIVGYSLEEKSNRTIKYSLSRLSLLEVMQYGISHQAMFIKRLLFEQLGYYSTDLKILSDCEFLYKCALKEVSFINLNECVALVEPGGLSNTMLEQMKNEVEIIKRVLPSSIKEDYQYILSKKQIHNIAIDWFEKSQYLFRVYSKFNRFINKIRNKFYGKYR
jgi:glycosyltransferase involved in cell wall biosynthesis